MIAVLEAKSIDNQPVHRSGANATKNVAGAWRRYGSLRRLSRPFALCLFVLASINLLVQPRSNFHAVVPGTFYRSAQPDAGDIVRWKSEYGLRTIVNLRGDWPCDEWYREEIRVCREAGIEQHNLRILSFKLASLDEIRQLIRIYDESPKPILVHCRQGADRTGLAAAIYMLLRENQSLEESSRQFTILCGHTGHAFGDHLPSLFECYTDWLKINGRDHSAQQFRRWIATESAISFFGSRIELLEPRNTLPSGVPNRLCFRTTNTSRYEWKMANSKSSGIRFRFWIHEREGSDPIKLTLPSSGEIVKPGEHIDFSVEIPPLTNTTKTLLVADLEESTGIRFSQMGDDCWTQYFVIEPGMPAQVQPPKVTSR